MNYCIWIYLGDHWYEIRKMIRTYKNEWTMNHERPSVVVPAHGYSIFPQPTWEKKVGWVKAPLKIQRRHKKINVPWRSMKDLMACLHAHPFDRTDGSQTHREKTSGAIRTSSKLLNLEMWEPWRGTRGKCPNLGAGSNGRRNTRIEIFVKYSNSVISLYNLYIHMRVKTDLSMCKYAISFRSFHTYWYN
jgi:hypothetical protein